MRINKLSKADSFDLYTQTLSNFLLKKEAQEKINKLVKLASALGGLFDMMLGSGRAIGRNMATGSIAGPMADSIRQGELYADMVSLKGAGGAIDPSNIRYGEVLGKLTGKIETGSREIARAFIESNNFSPKMVELFFGSEDNIAKLYEVYYIKKYIDSGDEGLQLVGEFPELIARSENLALGLDAALPILKDDNKELLNRAFQRSSTGSVNFLNSEPEDLAQLRGWLDADPRDAARAVEEGTPATRVDTPDDAPTVRPDTPDDAPTVRPDTPDDALVGRRYTDEDIDDIVRRVSEEADVGNVQKVEELRGEISAALRQINDDMASLETRLREGTISRADYNKLVKALRKQGVKLESSTGGFIAKLKAAGASVATMVAFKNLATVAGILAAGAVVYSGYQYLFGDSPSSVDPGETGGPRQDNTVTISPEKVEAERAIIEGDDQAIQKILSDPNISKDTLEHIAEQYGKKMAHKLPEPFNGMTYVFLNESANIPAEKVSENLRIILDLLKTRQGNKFFEDLAEEDDYTSQMALNDRVDKMLKEDLLTKRRLRRSRKGRRLADRPKLRERKVRKYSEEIRSSNRLQKLSHLKEISITSTNNHSNNDTNMLKKADEVSKSYVKDAVKGLNHEDKTLREYFTGLGRLYDAESEKRNPDYEELYKLHDETGRDLTLSAHPKAIRVSDGLGNGGLVENGLEQKEKLEEVALSTPTGNFKSRYAKLENLLKKSSKT